MCGGDHLKAELAESQHAPGIPFELAIVRRDRCGMEARASSAGHGSGDGTLWHRPPESSMLDAWGEMATQSSITNTSPMTGI